MTGAEIAIIAGVGLGAYSAYQGGVDARAQAKTQAAFAEHNAKVAQMQAEAQRQSTQQQAEQHRRKADMFLSRQRARIGKSGVAMSGSPLLVLEDNANQLNIERSNILAQGEAKATSHEQQSILDLASAEAYRDRGSNAYKSGIIGAGATGLMGAGQLMFNRSLLNNQSA